MNAQERRQRSLAFKSSSAVQQCEDWSHIEEKHHCSRRFERPHNPEDLSLRHGYMPAKEAPFKYSETPSYASVAEQRDPSVLNVNSEYYDIKDHPECKPDRGAGHKCEVAELFADGHYVKEDEHKRCLLHTIHSQYADVGKSVSRGFQLKEGECYGMPTKKQPGDDAEGMMHSEYTDKGYVLKNRGEIIPETVSRRLQPVFNEDLPENKMKMKPAGVKVEKGPGVAETLCGGYGTDLPNYDQSLKVVKNYQDYSVVHGYIARKDLERPVCLGGKGAVCESMMDYRRQ